MHALVVENDPRISWLAGATLAASIGMLLLLDVAGGVVVVPSMLGFGLSFWLFTVVQSKERGLRRRAVEVSVTDDYLALGRKRVSRKKIHSGFTYVLNTQLPRTTLYGPLKYWSLRLEIINAEDGLRLLEQLGLAPWQTTTDFLLPSLVHAKAWRVSVVNAGNVALWVAIGVVLPDGLGFYRLGVAVTGWVVVQALFMAWPSRLNVGVDGVLVRWLGVRRFIPHSAITGAVLRHWGSGSPPQHTVTVQVGHGREVVVPLRRATHEGREQGRLLVLRIRECGIVQGDSKLAEALHQIERNGAGPGDWFDHLVKISDRGSYRVAALTMERLMDVVEDSRCPPETRGAAAVAARSLAGPRDLARLRASALATAHDELRRLLEGVADETPLKELKSRFTEVLTSGDHSPEY